jgi:hypothetical protein
MEAAAKFNAGKRDGQKPHGVCREAPVVPGTGMLGILRWYSNENLASRAQDELNLKYGCEWVRYVLQNLVHYHLIK